MAVPKSNQKAVAKYMKNNYDEIKIRVLKGDKEVIKAHADAKNETTNEFIKRAIHETMGREGAEKNIDVTKKSLPNMPDPDEKE